MRAGLVSLGMVAARFAAPAFVAVAIMVTTERIVGTTPIVSPVKPTGVVWHDRVFLTRHALEGWLVAHGSNYDDWAHAHPALATSRTSGIANGEGGLTGAAHATSLGLRLLLIGIAGAAALIFASVLPYSRGKLRQGRSVPGRGLTAHAHPVTGAIGGAAVALGGLRARAPRRGKSARPATATEVVARRRHPSTQPVRVRLHRPSVFARTPALPAYHYWLRALRHRYRDALWSVGAGALGAAVGFVAAHFLV